MSLIKIHYSYTQHSDYRIDGTIFHRLPALERCRVSTAAAAPQRSYRERGKSWSRRSSARLPFTAAIFTSNEINVYQGFSGPSKAAAPPPKVRIVVAYCNSVYYLYTVTTQTLAAAGKRRNRRCQGRSHIRQPRTPHHIMLYYIVINCTLSYLVSRWTVYRRKFWYVIGWLRVNRPIHFPPYVYVPNL